MGKKLPPRSRVSQSSHKFVLPPLLVAAVTSGLVGLFIQPGNVEDLTGGQYVGKDK